MYMRSTIYSVPLKGIESGDGLNLLIYLGKSIGLTMLSCVYFVASILLLIGQSCRHLIPIGRTNLQTLRWHILPLTDPMLLRIRKKTAASRSTLSLGNNFTED